MSWYRKNPMFALGLTLCALLVLGELAFIYERYASSREAARRVEQRKTDMEAIAQLTPPPTRQVAAAIEADLAKAQKSLASMQAELKGRGPAAERIRSAKVPAARTDAFFDLATFIEKTRELAARNQVEVRPEAARLGFAAFANEGPVPEHIEPVFRQRQIAQYLFEALLEARPRAVLAVQRERTLSKADREARAQALANGQPPPEPVGEGDDGPDYFAIDPRVTARVPGFIDTIPFRIMFTGQTAALRTFLNRLASFELPVLVREVEVETASAEESATQAAGDEGRAAEPAVDTASPSIVLSVDPAAPPAKSAPRAPRPVASTPIVTKTLSKFTVTVEYIDLVPPAAPPAETPPPPS